MASREEAQQYVTDFWDTFSPYEKELCLAEGFVPPMRCELITVDFVTGLGEIGRVWI